MTTPAPIEWRDTGTFGPEQADLDVAYAISLPPEASLAWVDARLNEIQSHLANLGAGRNMLAPIYHVPKVIVVQILLWVALSYPLSKSEGELYRFLMDQAKDLVHATHACKLFRDAALERPELWVRINLRHTGLAKLFLERSGDNPVSVFLYPRRHPDGYASKHRRPLHPSTLEILRPHFSRVKNLDLTFAAPTRSGYGGGNPVAIHLPALESLRIRNAWEEEGDVGGVIRETLDEPPLVFPTPDDLYPRLRKVTLIAIDVPWNTSLFHGLTELDLSSQAREYAPTFEEFLGVLGQCPGLEKLHITNSGPKGLPDSLPFPTTAKKVQLPHLQDLSITHDQGQYMDIPLLLAKVSIPPTTKIHIQCNKAAEPVICFSQMFPPEHPLLAELPKYGTLKYLHLYSCFHFRLVDEPSGAFLSFKVNRDNDNVSTAPSIIDFFKTFGGFAQHAEIYAGAKTNPWVDVLKALPNVESMKLKHQLVHDDFVAGLSVDVCPKLKKLSFEYHFTGFSARTADRQEEWLPVVKARAENGGKLEEFGLTFSPGEDYFTTEVVEGFKRYTGEFSCRGSPN